MNLVELLESYNIPYVTHGKNVSTGWIGINCPLCHDTSYHGGIPVNRPHWFSCWRCGSRPSAEIISQITGLKKTDIRKVTELVLHDVIEKKKKKNKFTLPIGCGIMQKRHREYLEKRGFDPEYLEQKYSLFGTDHRGRYSHRIIAPIFFNKTMISYQGRDITGQASYRYKACHSDYEIMRYKQCLYNIDSATESKVVVVEGITGVWKLGEGAVATFGIKYTIEQVMMLCKFKKVFIFFDSDDQAQEQADKMAYFLHSFRVKTERLFIDDGRDAGDLTSEEAKDIMKSVFK